MDNKMIADRIKLQLKLKGIKQKDIIAVFHTSSATMSAKLNGQRVITAEDIILFSEILGCSTEYLLKDKPPRLIEVTKDEEEFFKAYFALNEENQKLIRTVSNALFISRSRRL